ncbi:MAG: DAK2 domain-containing protein [Lachnospiraceae bacterium]
METNTIGASMMAKMFLAGAKNLEAKKEWINELNVFPVPDGDTGTNMTMTIMSAAREVAALENPTIKDVAKAISSGSLRGARGNSGVILSQLFRGFTKGIEEHEQLTIEVLADAFEKAVETAYKAVMKPKEGTILTVAKGVAQKAEELATESTDIIAFAEEIVSHAEHVLSKTPDMLPVLKQAGVVDSGGQGLVEVLKGALAALKGEELDFTFEPSTQDGAISKISLQTEQDIKFGYCTEFLVVLNGPVTDTQETEFKDYLGSIGDSIVLVSDDEIIKIHVHTNDPGQAITKALTYGTLSRIKIDNMREEHQEMLIKDAQRLAKEQSLQEQNSKKKEFGFISVSIGSGLNEIFSELGVDYLIEGGQTMNPSTEDILNAISKVHAETIFILPNNKNIILAANQAAALTQDKNIIVIPTKTIPQGITALINFIPDHTAEENLARMSEEITIIKTGQITHAVRDTTIDDKEIHLGDYMGIGDTSILSVGTEMEATLLDMVEKMVDDESSIISLYFGDDVQEADVTVLVEKLADSHPDMDVEYHYGGQPIYYYIVSVE